MQLLDQKILKSMVKGKTKEEILGEGGILKGLIKSLVEAAMEAEMDHHLGYEKSEITGKNTGNSRNGYSEENLAGDFGETRIEVPRGRNSTFEPIIVEKGQRRFEGFDDKIIVMYARGMSTRDIHETLKDMYGVDISPTLISEGHQRRHRGCKSMANSSARSSLSDHFFRCYCGKSQSG